MVESLVESLGLEVDKSNEINVEIIVEFYNKSYVEAS